MKKEILRILLTNDEKYVSGEEISRKLGVSRTAIWKNINILKQEGYKIDSIPSQGYLLREKPDNLSAEEIVCSLSDDFVKEVYVYPEIGSTNDAAKKLANEGAREGTAIIAEKQTSGKGRMGRAWTAEAGLGIWMSLILRPQMMPAQAWQLTFVSAVAVCQAIREFSGLAATIKWPNDIMLNEKKICGILTELNAEIDRINYIVVGIGINVNHSCREFPQEISATATSLYLSSGKRYRRMDLLVLLLEKYALIYNAYIQNGFSYILVLWREMNSTLGREVNVLTQQGTYHGTATDIGDDGQLIVRTPEGNLHRVMVGDISIRNR